MGGDAEGAGDPLAAFLGEIAELDRAAEAAKGAGGAGGPGGAGEDPPRPPAAVGTQQAGPAGAGGGSKEPPSEPKARASRPRGATVARRAVVSAPPGPPSGQRRGAAQGPAEAPGPASLPPAATHYLNPPSLPVDLPLPPIMPGPAPPGGGMPGPALPGAGMPGPALPGAGMPGPALTGGAAFPGSPGLDPVHVQAMEEQKKRMLSQQALQHVKRKMEQGQQIETIGRPVKRRCAGKTWVDASLGEWPANDHRLFVGNLSSEVTDEFLAQTFRRYPTFQKAKVVKDKFKPRGYGFVSFGAPGDLAQAIREMNGKYIGNRPVQLKKSNWEDRTSKNQGSGTGKKKKNSRNKPIFSTLRSTFN